MPSSAQGYVFAVCGEESHFRCLRRALARLRPRTQHPIFVLVDPGRNPQTQLEAQVIPVSTPEDLDHHQAAIYLKTSVHRYLPGPGPYCYLDSDVLAVSPGVDEVFRHFEPPVTFASDLVFPDSNLRTFSPHAQACRCRANHRKLLLYFQRLQAFTRDHLKNVDFPSLSQTGFYQGAVFHGEIRNNRWWTGTGRGFHGDGSLKYVQIYREGNQESITYYFPDNQWRWVKAEAYEPHGLWTTDHGLSFHWVEDGSAGYWLDQDGDSLRRDTEDSDDQDHETTWWYRGKERLWRRQGPEESGYWVDAQGRRAPSCDHLSRALEERFQVQIRDPSWIHWNGGVFLFDPADAGFLETWHGMALDLFGDSRWRVRDQGALVAAAWAHGLEDQPRLPRVFNLIADRQGDPGLWPDLVQVLDSGEARLAHLVNGGSKDEDWPVWRALERAWSRPGSGRMAGHE
jgi:hypothetical protein